MSVSSLLIFGRGGRVCGGDHMVPLPHSNIQRRAVKQNVRNHIMLLYDGSEYFGTKMPVFREGRAAR